MFPVREQDGFVWVYPTANAEPDTSPFAFPEIDAPGYTTVYQCVEAEASVHATIENALDVPHTAFLHKGLFRGTSEPNEIDVVVSRWHDRVEAEYIGEPRPEGVVGRLLSPSGGTVTHFDRFFMPSIAQVEYSIGEENHILVTAVCTPVTDFYTKLHAVISFRTRIPGALIRPVVQPLALRIFSQDAVVLKAQTQSIHRFGGEQFVSTDIDLLGPHIWRLMRQAERGDVVPVEEPARKELKMRV
jgi:phenylpropionate dioxygenase-like ring-hydroxylating dioxygenase large terminal subunit